jgi:hypothetical protein
MNRIILIGNGFDLAHGLKTSYRDFIDDYWDRKSELFIKNYKEGKLNFTTRSNCPLFDYKDNDITITHLKYIPDLLFPDEAKIKGYERFKFLTMRIPAEQNRTFSFNNTFLEQITDKKHFNHWVDVEEEYYIALRYCLERKINYDIDQLNNGFLTIKKALEDYLKREVKNLNVKFLELSKKMYEPPPLEEIRNVQNAGNLVSVLFLNFNYTNTERLYIKDNNKDMIIHIHGELENPENPIIFGYGDEIDDSYKHIERKNDNKYLENIKSIKYLETKNYKNLLTFTDSNKYQVFVMGHSCGISDRTLLNMLFENRNCFSIKIFYHINYDGTDNFSDVARNLSRNFIDKPLFRKIVVDKTSCEPLAKLTNMVSINKNI